MSKVSSFMDLVAWQKSMDLVVLVYEFSANLPADERLGLVRQTRNAAVSIPSNIAEGYGRRTRGEYVQFLGISMGSLRELQTQLLLCGRLGLASEVSELAIACDQVEALIYSLERALSKV